MGMTSIISRCNICGKFFDSKKELRKHKDKNHRISNSKLMAAVMVEELITTTIPTYQKALSTREWLTD
jgi:C2H2-type zinc finger